MKYNIELPESKRLKYQYFEVKKDYRQGGKSYRIVAEVRHDDRCGNGHNTFAITGKLCEYKHDKYVLISCGSIHDDISKHIPWLRPFLQWHGCTTDGPLYYLENTLYHASKIPVDIGKRCLYLEGVFIKVCDPHEVEEMRRKYGKLAKFELFPNPMAKGPNLELARKSALWPDATLEQLRDKKALLKRLPELMKEFKKAVESLGLIY